MCLLFYRHCLSFILKLSFIALKIERFEMALKKELEIIISLKEELNIKCEVIVEQGLKSFFIFYLQIIKFRN